jgi:hypothetical protein
VIQVTLDAVIVAVTDDVPRVLVVSSDHVVSLPSGLLDPDRDRTLELAVRRWVGEQTGLELGYLEQLYTFGDLGRRAEYTKGRLLSVAYLALVHQAPASAGAEWVDWYEFLPWEDQRSTVDTTITGRLVGWADHDPDRQARVREVFGWNGFGWDGVRVLDRYELMYEAGLVAESGAPGYGRPMVSDHRRILATAIGRLRGKLSYRPVVFELLPEAFTLLHLQRVVEALAGSVLHKQNFRRLVERGGLVEGTGRSTSTGGRPAELFRFRSEVVSERPRPGVGHL